jgi:hypothetical protein
MEASSALTSVLISESWEWRALSFHQGLAMVALQLYVSEKFRSIIDQGNRNTEWFDNKNF